MCDFCVSVFKVPKLNKDCASAIWEDRDIKRLTSRSRSRRDLSFDNDNLVCSLKSPGMLSKNTTWGWGCISVVEKMLRIYEALDSICTKTNEQKTKNQMSNSQTKEINISRVRHGYGYLMYLFQYFQFGAELITNVLKPFCLRTSEQSLCPGSLPSPCSTTKCPFHACSHLIGYISALESVGLRAWMLQFDYHSTSL